MKPNSKMELIADIDNKIIIIQVGELKLFLTAENAADLSTELRLAVEKMGIRPSIRKDVNEASRYNNLDIGISEDGEIGIILEKPAELIALDPVDAIRLGYQLADLASRIIDEKGECNEDNSS